MADSEGSPNAVVDRCELPGALGSGNEQQGEEMLFYRRDEREDPFYQLYTDPRWLFPLQGPPLDFPLILDVETTNRCNLDCVFCSRQLMARSEGNMSFEVWRRIVDEAAVHGAAVRLNGWGEPLLHPDVVEQIQYASARGVLTKIYTNGTALTRGKMRRLMQAGLAELQFSMQGLTSRRYGVLRPPARYRRFHAQVSLAATARVEAGAARPFLSLLTSVDAADLREAPPDVFARDWLTLVDKVAIDTTLYTYVAHTESAQAHLADQLAPAVHVPCVDISLKLAIHRGGEIVMCGRDYDAHPYYTLGQVGRDSIHAAWHSPRLQRHRELVGEARQHSRFPLCRHCYTTTTKYEHLKARQALRGGSFTLEAH